MAKFVTLEDKERLLSVTTAILCAKVSNPNNTYAPRDLVNYSIRAAVKLIDTVFDDDEKLKEILNEHSD